MQKSCAGLHPYINGQQVVHEKVVVYCCNDIILQCLCSFTSHYFADLASTLEVVPIVDVKEGLAGSFFTISDFPLGLISISGQYMGTGAIATTPVITSAVKLAVTSPSPDPAMVSLSGGHSLPIWKMLALRTLLQLLIVEVPIYKSWVLLCRVLY